MYQPPHFVETRTNVLHELIRSHPLGLLASNGPGGPVADLLPFVLHKAEGDKGVLRAHLARSNPHWQLIAAQPDVPVLVVFQGPQAYVTPSWYQTKADTGKVVPTWNYVIVQVRGIATVHPEPEWILQQVSNMTNLHEAGRHGPWAVSDAPDPYIAQQLRAIVGVEIAIAALDGKWKVSQNRPQADIAGVGAGMAKLPGENHQQMAALVRKHGLKEQ